jgi:UDP-glucose 4-epimerase
VRVAVTGATGNIGTSLVRALAADPEVDEIVGVARRLPDWHPPKTRWVAADVAADDLAPALRGADAVVHLAWLIQPSRDPRAVHRANVVGSTRVFEAAAAAGAGAVVHASSIGAYSPGPRDRRVDESWPTDGVETSFYSRQKAYVERVLDRVELASPDLRVVRIRPSLVGKREAGTGLIRLFLGPVLPAGLAGRLPVGPQIGGLRLQLTHSDDIAEGFHLAALDPTARGAYNLTTEPVLEPGTLARALGRRAVPVPDRLARAAAALSWRLRLQPTPEGWLDLALSVPLLDATRARRELGWRPQHDAEAVLDEVVHGLREGAAGPTPPLERRGGKFRQG